MKMINIFKITKIIINMILSDHNFSNSILTEEVFCYLKILIIILLLFKYSIKAFYYVLSLNQQSD